MRSEGEAGLQGQAEADKADETENLGKPQNDVTIDAPLRRCIMDFSNLIKSKRFWAAAAVVAVVVLKDRVPLNEQQITEIVLAVGTWIVGESIRPVNPPEVAK